ncbi:ArsR/SmtB family transcription factor [Maritimibacter dapengensis]|uniref:Metalloregulator ArsR/SmtB family transcription factor n=1 Tax=Maritimibacter dapengensis TaxID=2836868 RepID=A0ABS6T753_9RHOB|nr:metalloregulator ArsR/SmtB family transcription factor [Maritimibacter dapengensis]MBV7380523.1 metalloregulator ArsR/SmtB family transcription factor [Maritimibacter dapengensis]
MENKSPELDAVFHALGDPTRRAVVQRLVQGEASVSDLARPFDMGLPAFMKHLGVLQDAGLVVSEKHGRTRTCRIQPETLTAAERWFEEQRAFWQGRYAGLDELLRTLEQGKKDET